MRFGLNENIIEKLIAVFEANSKVDKAIVFGSRAKGNYRPDSDIDIAIKGNNISLNDVLKMNSAFDESGIKYKVDLVDYDSIKEKELSAHIDRVGIELYSRWKKFKLGDLTEIVTKGTTPSSIGGKFVEKGINFIKSEAVGHDGRIDKSTFVFIDEDMHQKLKRSQLAKDDILFSMAGIYLGKNALVTEDLLPANTNQALAIIRLNKKKAKPKFIHYYLSQNSIVEFVNNMSGQSAQPNINFEEIKSIDILLPNLEDQKSIAEILNALDDKIDLLHRQNKTIEQLAETLFRQWFVEEAEENWERQPLGKFVEIKRGGSPRPIHDFISETGLNWLKISDVTGVDSPFIFEIKEKIKIEGLSKTTFLKKGSLILSNSATPGIPKILDVDSCIHDGWLHFPKSKFTKEFLYLFFKHIKPELLQLGNGSIFTNLKTDILKEYVLPIPNDESLIKFDEQVKTIFEKLYSNTTQIRTLTQLRDTLLPRLMSGEVRIN
jgi:type I restriction enzyme S subunit